METHSTTYHLTASEFDWQISEDKIVKAWGFNQVLPGPVLRVKKGEELTVKVTNHLPEPTIIHWHGIRLPALMDGTDDAQKPILPGEEFAYRFTLPDAGTFWYHSHYNETKQLERGMYGALIVEDEHDLVTDGEKVFLLDDMKLTPENEFTKPGWFIPRIMERHDGREGDTLLLNGKENSIIRMHGGQQERWRFINAASARYFVLHLGGKPFRIIGTDGGLIEKPREVTEILLAPAERVDIIAGPFTAGESFPLEALPYNRMTMLKAKRRQYATVQVGPQKTSVAAIPDILRVIKPLAPPDTPVNRKIKLSVGPSLKNGMNFLINDQMHTPDKPVKVGELQVWEVFNASLMDHPFHLHGFFFQVLEVDGKAPEYLAWKDTVNIGPRSKVKIAWMPDNRPGMWMYHCHILEHHAAGMMAHFAVIDPENPNPLPSSTPHAHYL